MFLAGTFAQMPFKPPIFRPSHLPPVAERERAYDAERGELEARRWYRRAIWNHPKRGLRALQLARQPLCEACLAKSPPELTVATIAHHKVPHRGDWSLFSDPANLGSWCKTCHDSEAQSAERAGLPEPR